LDGEASAVKVAARLAATFALRLAAVMLVTETRQNIGQLQVRCRF
jgi:hypothetical protein